MVTNTFIIVVKVLFTVLVGVDGSKYTAVIMENL